MKKIDEKKWHKFVLTLEMIQSMVVISLTYIIADEFFGNSLAMHLLSCVLLVIVLTPLRILIEQVVEKSVYLRRPFEQNEQGE